MFVSDRDSNVCVPSHNRFSGDTERTKRGNKLCRCDLQVYFCLAIFGSVKKRLFNFWILWISGLAFVDRNLSIELPLTSPTVQEATERAGPRAKKRDELLIPTRYGRQPYDWFMSVL